MVLRLYLGLRMQKQNAKIVKNEKANIIGRYIYEDTCIEFSNKIINHFFQ